MTFLPALAALLLLLLPSPATPAREAPAGAEEQRYEAATPAGAGEALRAAQGWEARSVRTERRGPGGSAAMAAGPLARLSLRPSASAGGALSAPEGSRPLAERLPYHATAPPIR